MGFEKKIPLILTTFQKLHPNWLALTSTRPVKNSRQTYLELENED